MVKLNQQWIKQNPECYNSDNQSLNLEKNDFDQIEKDAFKAILKEEKIKIINLKENSLTSFDFKIFEDFKELETLDVSYNKINSLKINPSGGVLISTSYPLKELYLNNNLINSINGENFKLKHFTDLHTIKIHNNSFREFDASLLKDLKQLEFLKLDFSKLRTFALEKMPEVCLF